MISLHSGKQTSLISGGIFPFLQGLHGKGLQLWADALEVSSGHEHHQAVPRAGCVSSAHLFSALHIEPSQMEKLGCTR